MEAAAAEAVASAFYGIVANCNRCESDEGRTKDGTITTSPLKKAYGDPYVGFERLTERTESNWSLVGQAETAARAFQPRLSISA